MRIKAIDIIFIPYPNLTVLPEDIVNNGEKRRQYVARPVVAAAPVLPVVAAQPAVVAPVGQCPGTLTWFLEPSLRPLSHCDRSREFLHEICFTPSVKGLKSDTEQRFSPCR